MALAFSAAAKSGAIMSVSKSERSCARSAAFPAFHPTTARRHSAAFSRRRSSLSRWHRHRIRYLKEY